MLFDALGISASLYTARGLVDGMLAGLSGASCPQWTGTGGDGYRARRDEAVANAHAVRGDISDALDLLSSVEADHLQALVEGCGVMPTSPSAGIGGYPSGRR